MCMKNTHGVGAGAVTLLAAELEKLPPAAAAMATVIGVGMGVLNDADHPDATIAHTFGFVTKFFAWAVGHIAGGHRWYTHSFLGVGIFTGIAWAAVEWRHDIAWRIVLCILLTLAFAAVGCIIPVRRVTRRLGIGKDAARAVLDLAAIGAAVYMAWSGTGLAYVALATATGTCTHLFLDWLTDLGCPLFLPLSKVRYHIPEPWAFTTDSKPEHWVVLPACCTALASLALYATFPALCLSAWAHIHHAI